MATIGTDHPNQASLRAEIRSRCGYSNDTVLMPDGLVDLALKSGLRQMNKMRPIVGIGSFPTVVSQQAYSPLPVDAYMIRNVWWPQGACLSSTNFSLLSQELAGLIGPEIDDFGTRTTLEPTAVYAIKRQRAWLSRMLGGKAHIDNDNVVRLIPVPASVSTVYFSFSSPRYATVFLIETKYEEGYWAAAEATAHRALAAGAGGVSHIRDTTTGTSMTTKAPEHHMRLAASRFKDFKRTVRPVTPSRFP